MVVHFIKKVHPIFTYRERRYCANSNRGAWGSHRYCAYDLVRIKSFTTTARRYAINVSRKWRWEAGLRSGWHEPKNLCKISRNSDDDHQTILKHLLSRISPRMHSLLVVSYEDVQASITMSTFPWWLLHFRCRCTLQKEETFINSQPIRMCSMFSGMQSGLYGAWIARGKHEPRGAFG